MSSNVILENVRRYRTIAFRCTAKQRYSVRSKANLF